MKVGFIGLGKLGLPVALAIESKGHDVVGYDVNTAVAGYIRDNKVPFREEGLQPLLDKTNLKVVISVDDVVKESDLIFLPVQTPHHWEFEGSTRLPNERSDFDYGYLVKAIKDVIDAATWQKKHVTLAVISTCLPGTFEREIKPMLNKWVSYVYTPQFIAMGTVLDDYLNPEFNLIGVEDEEAADRLESFYTTINDAPSIRTDVTTAEGIKVSYNSWITAKTVIANSWGELSQRLGMNFNDIKKSWDLSTKRLISPKYMNAGMSDGGGCHPRDNIAMSYIARKVGMSHNIWEDLMLAREDYEAWHAEVIADAAKAYGLPIVILGKAFKPETDIETGSPSILVANILNERNIDFTHVNTLSVARPAVYFIGTQNKLYAEPHRFPRGSVVIDVFGYIPDTPEVEVIRLGRR